MGPVRRMRGDRRRKSGPVRRIYWALGRTQGMDDSAFETRFTVRFRDMDPLGHVNNAVYATYLEIVRGRFYEAALGNAFDAYDVVLVHLEIDFHAPLSRNEVVSGSIRLADLGESSIAFSYELTCDSERTATAETIQVVVDPDKGEKVAVPPDWRSALRSWAGGS